VSDSRSSNQIDVGQASGDDVVTRCGRRRRLSVVSSRWKTTNGRTSCGIVARGRVEFEPGCVEADRPRKYRHTAARGSCGSSRWRTSYLLGGREVCGKPKQQRRECRASSCIRRLAETHDARVAWTSESPMPFPTRRAPLRDRQQGGR